MIGATGLRDSEPGVGYRGAMTLRLRRAMAVAPLLFAVPALGSAAAEPTFLFSQSAGAADARQVSGRTHDVTLRTAHRAVIMIEERPGRVTRLVPERTVTGLWRGTFRADPPNAVVSGSDARGRNHRAVVEITRAARVPRGVRYRMRVLRGSLPRRMGPVNMVIDAVPAGAISRPAVVPAPLLSAITFPPTVIRPSAPDLTVTTANPVQVGGPRAPVSVFGTVLIEPGARMQVVGTAKVIASRLVLSPQAAIEIGPDPAASAVSVALTATGGGTCATLGASGALLTRRAGGTLSQPAPVTARFSSGGGTCAATWTTPPAPAGQWCVPAGAPGSAPQGVAYGSSLWLVNTQQVPVTIPGAVITATAAPGQPLPTGPAGSSFPGYCATG